MFKSSKFLVIASILVIAMLALTFCQGCYEKQTKSSSQTQADSKSSLAASEQPAKSSCNAAVKKECKSAKKVCPKNCKKKCCAAKKGCPKDCKKSCCAKKCSIDKAKKCCVADANAMKNCSMKDKKGCPKDCKKSCCAKGKMKCDKAGDANSPEKPKSDCGKS